MFTGGAGGERDVLQSLNGLKPLDDSVNFRRFAQHGDNFKTVVVVEMNMLR